MATLTANSESRRPVSNTWLLSADEVSQHYPAVLQGASAPVLVPKVTETRQTKWVYLVANQIRFSDKTTMGICLAKPAQDKLYQWLNKIVEGGQCDTLYVENLAMGDFRVRDLIHRCEMLGVTLVNLTVGSEVPAGNVIRGPWH